MDAFTPAQTIELVARTGCKKAHMRLDKLFWNSFLAGPLLGFGCAILLSVNASPWMQEHAPGLLRWLGALPFPVGLVMIVMSGADLWTTNIMYMVTAFLSRRVTIKDVLVSWVVSYVGNLAGSLFCVAILFGYSGVFDEDQAYRDAAVRIASQKVLLPAWYQIFLRAISANWLVCFAVFSSIQAREVASKIIAIWWPTATFVGLALDHTIANEFLIPTGIWYGAPISVGKYIYKSMIASALGNMVGGGIFVGASYWYLYLTGEAGVQIAFDVGGAASAVDGGVGPMRLSGRTATGPRGSHSDSHVDPHVIDGVDAGVASGATTPGRGGPAVMSAFGHEMSDDSKYAKTWSQRRAEADAEARADAGPTDEKV